MTTEPLSALEELAGKLAVLAHGLEEHIDRISRSGCISHAGVHVVIDALEESAWDIEKMLDAEGRAAEWSERLPEDWQPFHDWIQ